MLKFWLLKVILEFLVLKITLLKLLDLKKKRVDSFAVRVCGEHAKKINYSYCFGFDPS